MEERTASADVCMSNYYYIHNTRDGTWSHDDLTDISTHLQELGLTKSEKAAIGEGIGGAGWETIIEVTLQVSSVLGLADILWKITKYLGSKKPKQKAPQGHLDSYRLVVHYEDNIIGVDMAGDINDINIAINDNLKIALSKAKNGNMHRVERNEDDWDLY